MNSSKECEEHRAAKIEVLRNAIGQGLESGPVAPLDMDAIKARSRAERAKRF